LLINFAGFVFAREDPILVGDALDFTVKIIVSVLFPVAAYWLKGILEKIKLVEEHTKEIFSLRNTLLAVSTRLDMIEKDIHGRRKI